MNTDKIQSVLKLFNKVVLIGERQTGKTTALIDSIISYAINNPNHQVIISTFNRRVIDQIRDKFPLDSSVTCFRASCSQIALSNGSCIRVVGTEDDLRGSSAEYFLIDGDGWLTVKNLNVCLPILLNTRKITIALLSDADVNEHVLALKNIECIVRL